MPTPPPTPAPPTVPLRPAQEPAPTHNTAAPETATVATGASECIPIHTFFIETSSRGHLSHGNYSCREGGCSAVNAPVGPWLQARADGSRTPVQHTSIPHTPAQWMTRSCRAVLPCCKGVMQNSDCSDSFRTIDPRKSHTRTNFVSSSSVASTAYSGCIDCTTSALAAAIVAMRKVAAGGCFDEECVDRDALARPRGDCRCLWCRCVVGRRRLLRRAEWHCGRRWRRRRCRHRGGGGVPGTMGGEEFLAY
eukprot:gene14408-biopygen13030